MNRRSARERSGRGPGIPGPAPSAALAVLLAAIPGAAQEIERDRPELMRGWLEEVLHRDYQAARDAYLRIADAPDVADAPRAVALARIVELANIAGETDVARARLGQLADLVPLSGRLARWQIAVPHAALAEALALPPGPDREARLAQARRAVEAAVRTNEPRRVVPGVLAALREAELERRARLERELAEARAAGDQARMRRLQWEMGSTRSRWRSTRQYWAMLRNGRMLVLNRLLEGRYDEADALLEHLQPRGAAQDERPDQEVIAAALAGIGRLGDAPFVDSTELTTARAVAKRLRELEAADRTDEAARLARRLPYRWRR